MKDKKILIMVSSFTQNNGVTNSIMNNYDELIKSSKCVDFLVLKNVDTANEKKAIRNGSKLYLIPKADSYISKKKMKFLDDGMMLFM